MSDSNASPDSLCIEGEMNIYRTEELMRALLTPLQSGRGLKLDLSAVTEIDTAGLQLLLLASRVARQGQIRFDLIAPSPAVLEVFELLRITPDLGHAPQGPA